MNTKSIVLELSVDEVEQCRMETQKEYPRIKEIVFYHLTYMVMLRSDGTGWVKIPV